MAKSEIITDAWEVTKTYAGRIAEWILFVCMVMNIIEILVALPSALSNIVLGTQVVMLDVGGFSLASMGDHARQQGDEKAAHRASVTGGFLIGITIVTLFLVTLGLLWSPAKQYTDMAEKGLILVRVVMTVIYGHVIHSLRRATANAQPTQNQVEALAQQLTQQAEELTATFNQQLQRLATELSRMELRVQQHLVEVENSVPAIDLETLAEAVSVTCETHLQTKIDAFLRQRVTVSPVPETPQIAGPRNVSRTHERDPKAGKATPTARAKPEFEGDPETVVYCLLDEDESRTHRTIAKMTGIPDTTVYRIRKRYLEERGKTVSSEPEENETAM
jgi:uncharacterized membrane-anchored protein YhcB (DUF1043 family)